MPRASKRARVSVHNNDGGGDEEHALLVGNAADAAESDNTVRLMAGSGQTRRYRQKLRRKQRSLKEKLASVADCDVEEVEECRKTNNELWGVVRHTREAVLDSENVEVIADKSKSQTDKLVTAPRYNAISLAQQLAKKGTLPETADLSRRFNWRGLSFQVGICFNALPINVSFLNGPLEAGYNPRRRRKRLRNNWKEFEEVEEETPEELKQDKKYVKDDVMAENKLSAVGRNIKRLRFNLRKRSREKMESVMGQYDAYINSISREVNKDEAAILQKKKKVATEASRVDATQVLFDPKSFTKTIENVCNFSFDVKESKAGIGVRSLRKAERYRREGIGSLGPGPVVYPVHQELQIPVNTQAILSLNMKQWRRMCETFDENYMPPQRGEGETATGTTSGARNRNTNSAEGYGHSPSLVTQIDDEQESHICNTDDRAADSECAAAITVTPEKDTQTFPMREDFQLQPESYLSDDDDMENNAKMGVDNPVVRNPFFHCDNSPTSVDEQRGTQSDCLTGDKSFSNSLNGRKNGREQSSQQEVLRSSDRCKKLFSNPEFAKSAGATHMLDPSLVQQNGRKETNETHSSTMKQEEENERICIDSCEEEEDEEEESNKHYSIKIEACQKQVKKEKNEAQQGEIVCIELNEEGKETPREENAKKVISQAIEEDGAVEFGCAAEPSDLCEVLPSKPEPVMNQRLRQRLDRLSKKQTIPKKESIESYTTSEKVTSRKDDIEKEVAAKITLPSSSKERKRNKVVDDLPRKADVTATSGGSPGLNPRRSNRLGKKLKTEENPDHESMHSKVCTSEEDSNQSQEDLGSAGNSDWRCTSAFDW